MKRLTLEKWTILEFMPPVILTVLLTTPDTGNSNTSAPATHESTKQKTFNSKSTTSTTNKH